MRAENHDPDHHHKRKDAKAITEANSMSQNLPIMPAEKITRSQIASPFAAVNQLGDGV